MVAVVTGGKAAEYANLKHLHVGSPPSDVSDLGEATDLDELLAMGSSQGPQTHPGIIWCAILSFTGFFLLFIVGCMVASNSLYIKVRPPAGKPKSSLAASVFLASFLYLCVFGTSVMYFQRARRAQKVYQLSLDVHAD
uniref:Transmembrane protein n=1 Tax=Hyaloperonospora arabidopsidis (strain Emoy2) TaxID=559515 RepID=M4BJ18_HYAAE